MSKTGLALASLAAALPGAALVYVLVMAFLNYSDRMSGALMGLAGLTLLLGAGMALMPAAVFVFGPKTAARPADAAEDEETEAAEEASADIETAEDEDADAEGADADLDADVEFDDGSETVIAGMDDEAPADDEYASDDILAAEGDDDFDFDAADADDFDDLEEPPPKKKR